MSTIRRQPVRPGNRRRRWPRLVAALLSLSLVVPFCPARAGAAPAGDAVAPHASTGPVPGVHAVTGAPAPHAHGCCLAGATDPHPDAGSIAPGSRTGSWPVAAAAGAGLPAGVLGPTGVFLAAASPAPTPPLYLTTLRLRF